MKELYHIVAIDNRYSVMARDFNGNFYLARKENSMHNPDVLVFASRDEAQKYIDDWFHPDYCVPEPFWIEEVEEEVDCDGRCLNCDYFDFISEDCTKGKE